jgi:hypothetical protein
MQGPAFVPPDTHPVRPPFRPADAGLPSVRAFRPADAGPSVRACQLMQGPAFVPSDPGSHIQPADAGPSVPACHPTHTQPTSFVSLFCVFKPSQFSKVYSRFYFKNGCIWCIWCGEFAPHEPPQAAENGAQKILFILFQKDML